MTEEQFKAEVICCNACCEEPVIIHQKKETLFSDDNPKEYYVCQCPRCFYMGYKSGYCKTPEGAVRSWNRKMIAESADY